MENSTETIEKQNESIWKNFKSIFPYLSVFIIILGLLYDGFYYSHFNIDIQDYVGVSELLLSVSKVAVYVIILTVIFFVLAWFQESMQIVQESKKNKKEVPSNATAMWLISITTASLIILLFVAMPFFVYPSLILVFYLGGYFIIATVTTLLYKKFKAKYLSEDKKAVLVTALVLITLFVVVKAFIQSKITQNGEYVGTTIYTKDSVYVSNLTHYYIGKTSTCYFIYNKDKNSATIIPERDVTRFEIKENPIRFDYTGNPKK